MSDVALSGTGIAKVYPPALQVLRGIDFRLCFGAIHGLLGANGAGKSTLIKILCGVEQPTGGTIEIAGVGAVRFAAPSDAHTAGIGVVHQELPLLPNLSAAENLVLGLQPGGLFSRRRRSEAEAAYRRLAASFPGAPPADVKLEHVGLQARQITAIIRARHAGARILILDEPTSSLDPRERAVLHGNLRRMAAEGIAILYVSHFLDDILDVCTDVTVLRDGRIVMAQPTAGLTEQDLLSAMTGEPAAATVAAAGTAPAARADGLVVDRLATGAVGPVSLTVGSGERVGLYGLEGSGCSAVLAALFGLVPARGRAAWRGTDLTGDPRRRIDDGIGFVSGDRARTMIGPWSLAMNHGLPRLGALSWPGRLDRAAERRDAARAIARLAVKGAPHDPLRTLSGGNQQKVAIGRWLDRSGVCLLADEPTRGVDVRGRAAIHQLLRDFCRDGNALLVRSTDPEELIELCDRVLVMVDGRVTRELLGTALTTDGLEAATRTAGRTALHAFAGTA